MTRTRTWLFSLGCGTLFGAGLVLSGMTQPAKVIGFLNVLGDWDPSLMFVMLGAIAVHALAYRLVPRAKRPLLADTFAIPSRRDIDLKLIVGALLFGAGWGLAGYCPGPALVALDTWRPSVIVFVLAMLTGTLLAGRLEHWLHHRNRRAAPASTAPHGPHPIPEAAAQPRAAGEANGVR